MKRYHYLYKTTNTVTGHYYIGVHSTTDLDDGYLGSGTLLQRYIQKYGEDAHTKEIIEYFPDRDLLLNSERRILTDDVLNDELCLNLKEGGEGGWEYINQSDDIVKFKGKKHSPETIEMIRLAALNRPPMSKDARDKIRKNHWSKTDPEAFLAHVRGITFHRKPKSDEHKRKISESLKGKPHDTVECPHCNKAGGRRAMKRWHFENCKLKA